MSRRLLTLMAGVLFFSGIACAAENPAAEPPGAAIYRKECASCHGKKGEGVAGKHDEQLIGRRNVAALAKYIAKTMPEDKEGHDRGQGCG